MKKRFFALNMARQYRTCPPLPIINDPVHRKNYQKHLHTCSLCSRRTKDTLTSWSQLLATMPRPQKEEEFSLSQGPSESFLKPGELRFLKPAAAGWKNSLFFNPPLLLVLDIPEEPPEKILAAMTYHDVTLSGPGDLVTGSPQSSMGELMIETWNTLTVPAGDFMPLFGSLPPDIIKAALRMVQKPDDIPENFPVPRPFSPDDPRIKFRRLERDAAAFFSKNRAENLFGLASGLDQAIDIICRTAPGIHWETLPESIPLLLASARFPDEYYARAAQNDTEKWSWANLILIRRGRTEQFKPVRVSLEKESLAEEVAFSGRVSGLPETMSNSRFFCFLSNDSAPPVSPEHTRWQPETGRFFVTFKDKSRAADELFMAVVGQSEK